MFKFLKHYGVRYVGGHKLFEKIVTITATHCCASHFEMCVFLQAKRWSGKTRGSSNFICTANTGCAWGTRKIHLAHGF